MNTRQMVQALLSGSASQKTAADYLDLLSVQTFKTALYDLILTVSERFDYLAVSQDSSVRDICGHLTDQISSLNGGTAKAMLTESDRRVISLRLRALERIMNRLGLDEHRLNRIELGMEPLPDHDSMDTLMSDIIDFINGGRDSAAGNARIRAVLEELPMTITRGKFRDLLKKMIPLYTGIRSDIAGDSMNRIEMLARSQEVPEDEQSCFPELWDEVYQLETQIKQLAAGSVPDAPDETDPFKNIETSVDAAARTLASRMSDYLDLQHIANALYVVLLLAPYVGEADSFDRNVLQVTRDVADSAGDQSFLALNTDVVGTIEKVVARQERLEGEQMMLMDAMEQVAALYPDLSSVPGIHALRMAQRIAYVPGTPDDGTADDPVTVWTREEAAQAEAMVWRAFEQAFSQTDRPGRRALMAKTLGMIPVPFDSVSEVTTFIAGTLDGVGLSSDRNASVWLLRKLIAEWEDET